MFVGVSLILRFKCSISYIMWLPVHDSDLLPAEHQAGKTASSDKRRAGHRQGEIAAPSLKAEGSTYKSGDGSLLAKAPMCFFTYKTKGLSGLFCITVKLQQAQIGTSSQPQRPWMHKWSQAAHLTLVKHLMWAWPCITSSLDKHQDTLPGVICYELKLEAVIVQNCTNCTKERDAVYIRVGVAVINQNKLMKTSF